MRGNDLLMGAVDVMVTDTLTGNILMKMFSSHTTGGYYESLGYGYGPGIGFDYERAILILSRASGVPVVANAIRFGAMLAKGNLKEVAKAEFEKVRAAGFDDVVKELTKDNKKTAAAVEEEIVAPEKEVVTGTVSGIDIMDLEEAVKVLWKHGVYAESGMGCTGPIVMVAEEKVENTIKILADAGYVSKEAVPC
jgi:glycine reductase